MLNVTLFLFIVQMTNAKLQYYEFRLLVAELLLEVLTMPDHVEKAAPPAIHL